MQQIIDRIEGRLAALEAQLHAHPELSMEEHETTRLIESVLGELPGLTRVELGLTTGTVWRLRGAKAGPTVGLRADIDAIRQQERVDRSDRSVRDGIMHACGHDVHTVGLLGAAMLLSELRDRLCGDVVFVFQPAEETLRGAKVLIEHGLFEKAPMDMLFGLHNQPALQIGTVGLREGALMAGKDDFILEIHGKSGHGGLPETCIDPIVAACGVVNALQTVVSRNVSPLESAVLSVCSFHGGTEENQTVDKVRLTGSIRTLCEPVRERVLTRMREISESCAAAYGCRAELTIEQLCRTLCNSENLAPAAVRAAKAVCGEESIRTAELTLGCEDFATYGAHVPIYYYFLGSGMKDAESAPWHKPDFRCAPGTALLGAKLLAHSVLFAQGAE